MLRNSFLHLPSIGPSTEQKLWKSGLRTMQDFLQSPSAFLSRHRQRSIAEHIALAQDRLHRQDAAYFCANLPAKEHWRIHYR